MTDSVNVSTGHVGTAAENARTFRHGAHSLGWVVDTSETLLADVRDELASGPYDAFAATHSANSLSVTIGSGEAFVGGVPLARDDSTEVSLEPNTDASDIYVGWAVQAKDHVVIGHADDFTSDDPKIPIWSFDTDSSGVIEARDLRDIDPHIDVQNNRYEGGDGIVDEAANASKIDGVTIGNLLRTDADDSISGRVGFTGQGNLDGPLGEGDGELLRVGGVASDLTMSIQGGHGRVMWSWNAYWDDDEDTWRSIVADELHACIGLVNNYPGYGTSPSSIVFGTSGKNQAAGDAVEWNWTGIDQYGNLDMGGNEIHNFSIETRDDRPSDPELGRIIYRSDQDDNLTY